MWTRLNKFLRSNWFPVTIFVLILTVCSYVGVYQWGCKNGIEFGVRKVLLSYKYTEGEAFDLYMRGFVDGQKATLFTFCPEEMIFLDTIYSDSLIIKDLIKLDGKPFGIILGGGLRWRVYFNSYLPH